MSDIFREVEEDVRKEKLEKFWKAYGDYIIALGALLILGIAGFELWQRYQANQRDKAAIAFAAAEGMFEEGAGPKPEGEATEEEPAEA